MIFSHKKTKQNDNDEITHDFYFIFKFNFIYYNWLINQADQTIKKMNIKLNPY